MSGIKIIGHRGYGADSLQSEVPENTLESFRKALECGADGIEFDVFRTQDGHLVIYGNKELDGKLIAEQTLEDIRKVSLAGGAKVPTFEEVLDLLVHEEEPGVICNVELKGDYVVEKTLAAIEQRVESGEMTWDQFLFSSFDWDKLLLVKERQPEAKIQPTTATVFIFEQQDVQMPGYHVPLSKSYNAAALNEVRDVAELHKAHAIDIPTFDIREGLLAVAAEVGCGFCTHPTGPSRQEDIDIFVDQLRMLSDFAEQTGLPVYIKVDDIPLAIELVQAIEAGEEIELDDISELYTLTGEPCEPQA